MSHSFFFLKFAPFALGAKIPIAEVLAIVELDHLKIGT